MTRGQTNHVAVIGNGLMGTGISQIFASAGWAVTLIGRSAERLAEARSAIAAGLAQFAGQGLMTEEAVQAALARIALSTRLEDAAASRIVVEAVTEDLELKRRIFADLDRICPPDCILASSSGQPASLLIGADSAHPERVIAAHFWFPAPLIPIVEVCPGPKTAPEVTARTLQILRAVGKDPVEMKLELPGMIGNRIQFAILREAWALWASGAASAEAIDKVVRKTLGRRLGITGPLESAELGGLETLHSFARSLLPHIDARPEPDPAITALVEGGARGPASGSGTYDWTQRDAAALRKDRADELFRWLRIDRTG